MQKTFSHADLKLLILLIFSHEGYFMSNSLEK